MHDDVFMHASCMERVANIGGMVHADFLSMCYSYVEWQRQASLIHLLCYQACALVLVGSPSCN